MSSELVLDSTTGDIPHLRWLAIFLTKRARTLKGCYSTYPDDLVFCASSQVCTVGAEADTANIQITILRKRAILEMCDWDTCLDIENLCRAVAASGDISSVQTETNAADYTLMGQIVDQVDVEDTARAGVEDGKPISTLFLEVIW